MAAGRSGIHVDRRRLIARGRIYDRVSLRIDARRPRYFCDWIRRDDFSRQAVDYVKECILRRMHDHLPALSVDRQIGQHQIGDRVVVPVVAGNFLVIPDHFPGGAAHGEDAARIEIVAGPR